MFCVIEIYMQAEASIEKGYSFSSSFFHVKGTLDDDDCKYQNHAFYGDRGILYL